MAIQSFVSVDPQNPWANTYDAANPNAPYAYGYMYSFGGVSLFYNPWRVGDQYNNNEIIVGYDAVPLADQDLYASGDHPFKNCTIYAGFNAYNVTDQNQFLLLFDLRGIQGDPTAQFFVGADLVDSEPLAGNEQHAILIDSPGTTAYITVIIRLASPNWNAAMGFKGMDCCLL